jgi:hypothetical protein
MACFVLGLPGQKKKKLLKGQIWPFVVPKKPIPKNECHFFQNFIK